MVDKVLKVILLNGVKSTSFRLKQFWNIELIAPEPEQINVVEPVKVTLLNSEQPENIDPKMLLMAPVKEVIVGIVIDSNDAQLTNIPLAVKPLLDAEPNCDGRTIVFKL
jgi:hypothetical protein